MTLLAATDVTSAQFWLGLGAVLAAVVVFPGSIWLVLSMYVGKRIAYFVVACVCLGVLLILGFAWSFASQGAPLGPVGTLPSWKAVGVGAQASDISFAPARSYPNPPWHKPAANDQEQQDIAGSLSTPATDLLTQAIGSGRIKTFASASDAAAEASSVRLLQQNGTTYGAISFRPVKPSGSGQAVVVMRYDPGNPLGTARMILIATAILLVAHLAVLYTLERRAARAAGRDLL